MHTRVSGCNKHVLTDTYEHHGSKEWSLHVRVLHKENLPDTCNGARNELKMQQQSRWATAGQYAITPFAAGVP